MTKSKGIRKPKPVPAPLCCERPARLTDGREVYPHRPDLFEKRFYVCDACAAYCGCHPDTIRALGVPADAKTRDARSKLHDMMLDPLWKNAVVTGEYYPEDALARSIITKTARTRVYAFLATKLGIDRKDCHTGLFTYQMCRDAWVALNGVTYPQIRDWAHADKAQRQAADAVRQAMADFVMHATTGVAAALPEAA